MEFDTLKGVLTYLNVGLVAFFTFLFKTLGLKISIDLTKYSPIKQVLLIFSILLSFIFVELVLIYIFMKVVN